MASIEELLMAEEAKVEGVQGSPEVEQSAGSSFKMPSFGFLKAQSIDRPVESYTEHALNFDKKMSTGRIIRGLEGILGALNYAIIDIVMGLIEKSRERKEG